MSSLAAGIFELGMFDAAAQVLEEIAPEDKSRNEVLGARVVLYMAAKKWDMAAAVDSHLVKVEPENEAWWINLAYSVSVMREKFACSPTPDHGEKTYGRSKSGQKDTFSTHGGVMRNPVNRKQR
jgi:lipopolysaccharide biosynthesis regulator YciM